jgi:DNA gyrase subunit A
MYNDLTKELGQNFIEYAVAVNTDRAIPDAKSGLKPVAKRILYAAFDGGYSYTKPHVKSAAIVGDTMGRWHPHGDSSIYGALVRLAQPWVMRYPLIDFHGSMGNRDGDGPAAARYTEARLSKLSEEGMLAGIKKNNIDFMPNYDETRDEPITLPALFPNLLCNPNTGIGVAMACNWLPHNLGEVATAIYDYLDGKEPTLLGPDFPTGGLVINKNDIPSIMKTGKGSIKLRGKYNIEDNNIVFYEIPYGIATEELMNEIGAAADEGKINGIKNIRNESNRKGFRLVIECDKGASIATIINLLFKETSLQISVSYNQVALVDKTPTELTLKDCIKIYVEHNTECIRRETEYDLNKTGAKLEIVNGLLKALEDIDNIIALIKASASAAAAKTALMEKYSFTEPQAKAIVDMKLGRLAGLERIEIENEKKELLELIETLNSILANLEYELRLRLANLVEKYGDARRTELTQVADTTKEEKEIEFVEPEQCVVVMTEGGTIKRIPQSSFRTQKRNTKGVKTQEDITSCVIRTNTVDSLMIFTNQGNMYRLLVDNIPVGTNVSKGTPITGLIEMEENEKPTVIYSIYRDTDAKYILFVTKNGLVKKTSLDEYTKTKKKSGILAINIKDNDELASVFLVKDEDIVLITELGNAIKFNSMEIGATSRATSGVKGITLKENDAISVALPVHDTNDQLAIFMNTGIGKKIKLSELPNQKRAGKGLAVYKIGDKEWVSAAALVADEDNVLIVGNLTSVCISAADIPSLSRASTGNQMIKGNQIKSVSKV